jgi:hypothetical protein
VSFWCVALASGSVPVRLGKLGQQSATRVFEIYYRRSREVILLLHTFGCCYVLIQSRLA